MKVTLKTSMKHSLLCAALLAAFALPATVMAALPAFTQQAEELARLPGGGWLALDKHGLHLFDRSGREQDSTPVRAKQLDTRIDGNQVLAVFLEADTQRPVPVTVDLQAGKLTRLAPFPDAAFSVEASCLYRDAQRLDHLFLIAKDGQAEQWVMQGEQRRLVRKLALPPHVKHCRVDDGAKQLLVSEGNLGVWAYEAESEGMGQPRGGGAAPPLRPARRRRRRPGRAAGRRGRAGRQGRQTASAGAQGWPLDGARRRKRWR